MKNNLSGIKSSTDWLHRKLQIRRLQKLVASDTPPSGWFQGRKIADREIRHLSSGQLVLAPYQLYYHGDDRSHWVEHISCGNSFRMSLTELRLEGPDICPFCHGGLLSRIGTPERINDFIFKISSKRVLFLTNQLLLCSNVDHHFFHLGCKKPFIASFDYVVDQCLNGNGSGCTECGGSEK